MDKARSAAAEITHAERRQTSMSMLISVASIDGLLSKDFGRVQRRVD
jgi:hypothetical protein